MPVHQHLRRRLCLRWQVSKFLIFLLGERFEGWRPSRATWHSLASSRQLFKFFAVFGVACFTVGVHVQSNLLVECTRVVGWELLAERGKCVSSWVLAASWEFVHTACNAHAKWRRDWRGQEREREKNSTDSYQSRRRGVSLSDRFD